MKAIDLRIIFKTLLQNGVHGWKQVKVMEPQCNDGLNS